MTDIYCRCIYF